MRKCVFVMFMLSFIFSSTAFANSKEDKIKAFRSDPDFNPEDQDYIILLLDWGKDLEYVNKDSMFLLVNEGLALSLKSNYKRGEAWGNLFLADYYVDGEVDTLKSKHHYEMALEIARKHQVGSISPVVLTSYGRKLYLEGDFAGALIKWLEGIELAEKEKHESRYGTLATLYNNVAVTYQDILDLESSLKFHTKSKELGELVDNKLLIGRSYLNMSITNKLMKNYSEAEVLNEKAIVLLEEEKAIDLLSHSYAEKGHLIRLKKSYDEALMWFDKSLEYCNDLDYQRCKIVPYNGMAETYLNLDNPKKAIEYAQKAYELTSEGNNVDGLVMATLVLSLAHKELGDFKEALKFKEEHFEVNENFHTEVYRNSLATLRSKFKYEEEKKLLLEDKKRAVAKQQAFIYLLLGGFVTLASILFLLYRNNKTQQKFNAELKRKQEILIQRETELQLSNETKDKIFSIIAHDLKGPINSFYGLMSLYLDGTLSKKNSEFIFPKLLNEIRGISEMLNNLLLWGKTQMKGIEINQQNVDIAQLVSENILLLNPTAEKKGISMKSHLSPDTLGYCDSDHIGIVIRNILNNAIKFTNQYGEIHIDAIETGAELQIEIKDNGIGMNEETQASLFVIKNNKSLYGTNQEKGAGLGLSLSKEMIESNGGRIWSESELGQGTSIYFTVPLRKRD